MIYLRGKNKENIMKKTEKTKSNSYLFWGSYRNYHEKEKSRKIIRHPI